MAGSPGYVSCNQELDCPGTLRQFCKSDELRFMNDWCL